MKNHTHTHTGTHAQTSAAVPRSVVVSEEKNMNFLGRLIWASIPFLVGAVLPVAAAMASFALGLGWVFGAGALDNQGYRLMCFLFSALIGPIFLSFMANRRGFDGPGRVRRLMGEM